MVTKVEEEKELAKRGSNRVEYLCLRNCFVGVRLWKAGRVYILPEEMEKDPKNFRKVGEPVIEEQGPITDTPDQPRELKPDEYSCSKCNSIHRETSKLGQKHLKYKE